MRRVMPMALVVALVAGTGLLAQKAIYEGEPKVVTATIEAIDQSSRTITVKDDKGIYETLDVPPTFTRFNELKVGDKITARYYDNVVVRVKKPNEPAQDVASGALTKSQTPGATAATRTSHGRRSSRSRSPPSRGAPGSSSIRRRPKSSGSFR